jgi:hypothetical protein
MVELTHLLAGRMGVVPTVHTHCCELILPVFDIQWLS